VLERATGTDWRTAVEQLVLDPLDLGRTHTGSEGRSVVPGTLEDGRGARIRTDEQPYTAVETTAASSGALLSTAEDLARFGHALLDRSQIPADQWQELTAFSGPPDSYGLSLADLGAQSRRTGSGGPFALGNAGEIPGYGATLLLYPEAGAAWP
jgi:CubicO group peptidase (beta-lactamase class C family)